MIEYISKQDLLCYLLIAIHGKWNKNIKQQ